MAENKQNNSEYDGKTPLKGKRELFAKNLAKGDCNQTEAARKSGYKDNKGLRKYAHTLSTNPDILKRIGYLKAKLAEKYEITREKLILELDEAIESAKAANDHSNWLRGLELTGKMAGLFADRVIHEASEAQKELDALRRKEAKKIARLLQSADKEVNVLKLSG